ncbi:hypothetical protein BDQ17DRAFT_1348344 [Cyathus striatus]|nr:hypothetical protein BDQ17DRAFT_1348344 [Cyathus striatus]
MSPVFIPSDMCSSESCDTGVHLMKRDSPKIGGSVTGFIIVVVVLVIIIVTAGSAAIYLWRDNASTNDIRRSKHARYHKKHASGTPLIVYGADAGDSPSWFARLGKLPGLRKLNRFTANSDKGIPLDRADTGGWTHARSGSDFSYSGDRVPQFFSEGARPEAPKRTHSPSTQPRSILSGSSIPSPRHSIVSSDSSLNVRFELQGIRGLSYPDRFSPSPQPTLPSIHRQLSSHSSSNSSPQFSPPIGLRTTSPELAPESQRHASSQGRQNSSQSGHSVMTFEGGTKFIEGL